MRGALSTLVQREHARGIDYERIVLAGFSQGGAMALHAGLRSERALGAILVLSGYLPQLIYERGRLDQSMPYPALRQRSRVNGAAMAAGLDAPDFSARIREGLPRPGT